MNLYDLILEDHRRVEALLDDLEASSEADECSAIFLQLEDALLAHGHAEERVVYARLAAVHDLQERLAVSIAEHQRLERLLARMRGLDPKDLLFTDLLRTLRRSVQEHVDEEERDLLPMARRILGDDADGALGALLRRREDEELGVAEEGGRDGLGP